MTDPDAPPTRAPAAPPPPLAAPLPRLTADWLSAPHVRAVAQAFAAGDAPLFFVGGCVRDAILGITAADIDLATPARPEVTMRLLEAAGLKAVPTGAAHGTITAVADKRGMEITTFRADIATDGRHATVAFTGSMAEDAARRDFTMNALYADPAGEVFDPLGGLPDLLARRVRFIGAPEDRIREDYLRILRFFRFFAWHGDPADGLDPDGLAACAALSQGIEALSRERVGAEMKKLLAAPDPAPAVAGMAASGVLAQVLPGAAPHALAPLVHLEGAIGAGPDWRRRAGALMAGQGAAQIAGQIAQAWRLSKQETKGLTALVAALEEGEAPAIAAWRHGAVPAFGAALIAAAGLGAMPPADLEAEIARGAAARFPLTAAALMRRGHAEGPALGAALARAQAAWIASDLTAGSPDLIAAAEREG
jgi:poly(A) polymerase